MERPENYEAIQYGWTKCDSDNIEEGARTRVRECVKMVRDRHCSIGNVAVIGPQWGYELEEFAELGADRVIGIECVPDYVDACRFKGFEIIHSDAENFPDHLEGEWNFYSSHSLEHCYDLDKVIANVQAAIDSWFMVTVPIEKREPRDKAHFSPIKSEIELCRKIKEMGGGRWLDKAWSSPMNPEKATQTFSALFFLMVYTGEI